MFVRSAQIARTSPPVSQACYKCVIGSYHSNCAVSMDPTPVFQSPFKFLTTKYFGGIFGCHFLGGGETGAEVVQRSLVHLYFRGCRGYRYRYPTFIDERSRASILDFFIWDSVYILQFLNQI